MKRKCSQTKKKWEEKNGRREKGEKVVSLWVAVRGNENGRKKIWENGENKVGVCDSGEFVGRVSFSGKKKSRREGEREKMGSWPCVGVGKTRRKKKNEEEEEEKRKIIIIIVIIIIIIIIIIIKIIK